MLFLSIAKLGLLGLFWGDTVLYPDLRGLLSPFFKRLQAVQVSVSVQTHLNESLCLLVLPCRSCSGFGWLWLEQSWQDTILPIYSVDYTPLEDWCQLTCHLCIFRDLPTASPVIPQERVRSRLLSFARLFSPELEVCVARFPAFVLGLVPFLCRNYVCQHPVLATVRAARSFEADGCQQKMTELWSTAPMQTVRLSI